jgi:hypothetical protein
MNWENISSSEFWASKMTRRQFLIFATLLGSALILAACGDPMPDIDTIKAMATDDEKERHGLGQASATPAPSNTPHPRRTKTTQPTAATLIENNTSTSQPAAAVGVENNTSPERFDLEPVIEFFEWTGIVTLGIFLIAGFKVIVTKLRSESDQLGQDGNSATGASVEASKPAQALIPENRKPALPPPKQRIVVTPDDIIDPPAKPREPKQTSPPPVIEGFLKNL